MMEPIPNEQAGDWLRRRFFADPNRQIRLAKGDTLLQPGQYNERLFMVLEGLLVGSIENSEGRQYEIFRSTPGKLVGAYSFFASSHTSYSIVVAEEPTLVAFVERNDFYSDPEANKDFMEHVMPAVVDEIYLRQLQAHELTIQREEAMQQMSRMEKLAALGQMAAGLAHELNNAIGVISKNAEWLSESLKQYLSEKETPAIYPFFEAGLQSGITLSSTEVRQRSKDLEARFGLSPAMAKNLAKANISEAQLSHFGRDLSRHADHLIHTFEMGRVLYDMLHASSHATKVVASVQQLGAATRSKPQPIQLNDTIQGALALVRNLTKTMQVELHLGELPVMTANAADWVQVWINLIKNAAEALQSARTPKPRILLRTYTTESDMVIQVQDNGPGIPEELQPHVFQPNVTTKVEGLTFGLGLGLSIVQKIIETYHGAIELESRPGFTLFTVKIPF